jgi:undecaprenyl-diphosphatase
MEIWQSLILGVVEGLTEFLPISSTGHLILSSDLMGLTGTPGIESFEIGIQSGAILAVIALYRKKIRGLVQGLLRADSRAWQEAAQVILAFLPLAVLGVLFGKNIKQYLFGPWPVVSSLAVGGLFMIVFERRNSLPREKALDQVQNGQQALGIGFFQCLALWPGTSRAMATILGARLLGLSARGAAEFSFLLAIPTLLGASVYDLVKHSQEILNSEISASAWAVGLLSAFLSAWLVIQWFIRFLSKNSLEVFGWYRIILAALYALLFLR